MVVFKVLRMNEEEEEENILIRSFLVYITLHSCTQHNFLYACMSMKATAKKNKVFHSLNSNFEFYHDRVNVES
jgi:hypothetical protein